MHGGAMWLVSCGCGAIDEFEQYREARAWQDAHDSACERHTDLWAPELFPEQCPRLPAAPPMAPQALSLARA